MKIHLGENDLPYGAAVQALRMRTPRRGGRPYPTRQSAGGITTGDVANILEHKYALFSVFAAMTRDFITDVVTESMRGELQNVLMGKPANLSDPFAQGMSAIEARFRDFLDYQGMDGRAPGVPTKAALMGRSIRLKRRRGPPRPSFIDSGLMRANFRSWVES
jgi:hypothetical protein